MNGVTREIAELLSVDLPTAAKMQDYIEEYDLLDFSECSSAQFRHVVKESWEALQAV